MPARKSKRLNEHAPRDTNSVLNIMSDSSAKNDLSKNAAGSLAGKLQRRKRSQSSSATGKTSPLSAKSEYFVTNTCDELSASKRQKLSERWTSVKECSVDLEAVSKQKSNKLRTKRDTKNARDQNVSSEYFEDCSDFDAPKSTKRAKASRRSRYDKQFSRDESNSRRNAQTIFAVPRRKSKTTGSESVKSLSLEGTKAEGAGPGRRGKRKAEEKSSDNSTLLESTSSLEMNKSELADVCEQANDSSSSESEWEEVEDAPVLHEELHAQPAAAHFQEEEEKTVSITLQAPVFNQKKKKSTSSDMCEAFRHILNRYRKRSQENMHKTHLLCLLSHGQWRNRLCSNELLMSVVLSVIPVKYCNKPADVWDLSFLIDFVKWFHGAFTVNLELKSNHQEMLSTPLLRVASRKVSDGHEHTLLFVTSCRALGLRTRLVYSLQPVSFKATDLLPKNVNLKKAFISSNEKGNESKASDANSGEKRMPRKLSAKDLKRWHELQRKDKPDASVLSSKETRVQVKIEHDESSNSKNSAGDKKQQVKEATATSVINKKRDKNDDPSSASGARGHKQPVAEISNSSALKNMEIQGCVNKMCGGRRKRMSKIDTNNRESEKSTAVSTRKVKKLDDDNNNDTTVKRSKRSCSRKVSYIESCDSEVDDEVQSKRKSSAKKPAKKSTKKRRSTKSRYSSDEDFDIGKTGNSESEESEDSDECLTDESDEKKTTNAQRKRVQSESEEDFEVSETSFRPSPSNTARVNFSQKKRSSAKFVFPANSPVCDWWAEVYLDKERRWIGISSINAIVDHPEQIEAAASQPLSYVVAYYDDESLKDVTKKYTSDWLSSTWKLRLDESWWQQVLLPYQSKLSTQDECEDQHIEDILMNKPMPTTICEFKNHPLYVLPRHLLKFEAIYPSTAVPLGFIHGEPIYARECVQLLHARERWIQEGRSVKEDEEPYKLVKARPKRNKSKEFNDALKLPLFGRWQTEQYIPPPAVDGIVPVNQYGNVDLFKPWMLPGGTIHLKDYPGLNRVAKKLNIDCRPAMTGWDFHGGCNHPVFDGWVVCEENVDVLVAAWEEDQAILKQREHEKKMQRVIANWTRLVKGLLILRRLRSKFEIEKNEGKPDEPTKQKTASPSKPGGKRNQKKQANKCHAVETLEEDADNVVVNPALNWPQNRAKSIRTRAEERSNLFPFEKS